MRLRRAKLLRLLKDLQLLPLAQMRAFAKQVVLLRPDVPVVRPLKVGGGERRPVAAAP